MRVIFSSGFWIHLWQHSSEAAARAAVRVVALLVLAFAIRLALLLLVEAICRAVAAGEGGTAGPAVTGRLRTIRGLARSFVSYTVALVFGTMVLGAIGLNIMPLVTAAGVLGIAIGFGAQKLVRDVISGFFLVVDDAFAVGEVVTIGAITGVVRDMGVRVTHLEDAAGRRYHLANGDIGTVTNLSRGTVKDSLDLALEPHADIAAVRRTVAAVGERLTTEPANRLLMPPVVAGLASATATALTIRISVVAPPLAAAAEQMRVREAVVAALSSSGIALGT